MYKCENVHPALQLSMSGVILLLLLFSVKGYACKLSLPDPVHGNFQPFYLKVVAQEEVADSMDGKLELIYPWSLEACDEGVGAYFGVLAFDMKQFSSRNRYELSSFNWGKYYYFLRGANRRFELLTTISLYRSMDFDLAGEGESTGVGEKKNYLLPAVEMSYALNRAWKLHAVSELLNYDHDDNYIVQFGISHPWSQHRKVSLVTERRSWHMRDLVGFDKVKGYDRSVYLKVVWNINKNRTDDDEGFFNLGLSMGQRRLFQQLDDGAVTTGAIDVDDSFVLLELGLGRMNW